ncbi:hypothetical protein EDB19DRAFT_1370389 [Suillus lakei]|nr:hypothetical protein EDB19DRAFT_1370389 [Suillus lakei]
MQRRSWILNQSIMIFHRLLSLTASSLFFMRAASQVGLDFLVNRSKDHRVRTLIRYPSADNLGGVAVLRRAFKDSDTKTTLVDELDRLACENMVNLECKSNTPLPPTTTSAKLGRRRTPYR